MQMHIELHVIFATDVHQWIVKMKQAKFKNCSNILLSINNDYIVIVCIDSTSRSFTLTS